MAEGAESAQQLFKRWQSGDGAAGQAMAQKFTDWFYAIAAVRLGDQAGRVPLERACQSFAAGITGVPRSGELVPWAHGIVSAEIKAAGGRTPGGDFPNALTGNRPPTRLLERARQHLTEHQVELLAMTFDSQHSLAQLESRAEELGGWPHAILDARYALKRVLRRSEGVNFSVAPESPDLDRAPLPLYEAGRMASADEEAAFEQWLLTDIDLCRDVAEFATFAHALRTGLFARPLPAPSPAPAPAPTATTKPATARRPAPPPAAADEAPYGPEVDERPAAPKGMIGMVVATVLLLLAIIVAVLNGYLG
jgi:ribosome modulation factor